MIIRRNSEKKKIKIKNVGVTTKQKQNFRGKAKTNLLKKVEKKPKLLQACNFTHPYL